jgi:hypothetical protein
MTSLLQLLDVSVNKVFKYLVCKRYVAWMNKDNHILTLNGQNKKSISVNNSGVISKAWKEVPVNIIPVVFKVLIV